MPMRPLRALLPLLLLAACATAPAADPTPIVPTATPAPAEGDRVALETGGSIVLPGGWTLEPTGPEAAGASRYQVLADGAPIGTLLALDLEAWEPSHLPPAQAEALGIFLRELAGTGSFSPGVASSFLALEPGGFFAPEPQERFAPSPWTHATPDVTGFSFVSFGPATERLLPVAWSALYDAAEGRFVLLRRELGAETAVARKNEEVAAGTETAEGARSWFRAYAEATPRSALPWGEDAEVMDETLRSYRR